MRFPILTWASVLPDRCRLFGAIERYFSTLELPLALSMHFATVEGEHISLETPLGDRDDARDEEDDTEGEEEEDVRTSAWFVQAATTRRNVVVIVDLSASMWMTEEVAIGLRAG